LEGSTPGACIEMGLNVVAVDNKKTAILLFDIIHTCSSAIPDHLSSMSILLPASSLATQLIDSLGGLISVDNLSNSRTRFKVKVEMHMEDGSIGDPLPGLGNADHVATTSSLHKSYHHIKFANEPTIQELSRFMGHLKGLKMVLHAKEQSAFAKHLTGCLASWNCDISHVSVSRLDDSLVSTSTPSPSSTNGGFSDSTTAVTTPLSSSPTTDARRYQHDSGTQSPAHIPSPVTEEEQLLSTPPAFVLIDDHLLTLERTLLEFRTRSSPEQRRPSHGSTTATTTAILHFTSMANYSSMRDIIQWASTLSTPYAMPRIVVVPKPSGPRRYLTALHTAWHNAMVEPHYIPIATSPTSPVPTVLLSSMLSQVIDPASIFTPDQHPRRSSSSVPPHDGACFDRASPSDTTITRRRSHQHDLLAEGTHSPQQPEGLFTAPDPPPIPPMDGGTPLSPEPCPVIDLPTPLSPPPPSSSSPPDPDGTKPVVSRTIKLVKRKKKDKGPSFANVVSPPIHVLIVEGKI
jgi:osomolarity two-component system response regulator SSK1